MAFIRISPQGAFSRDFISVGQQVGKDKANVPQDVLVVQALLAIVFIENPAFKAGAPSKRGLVVVEVSNNLEPGTPALIRHFQKVKLKRGTPEGFINKAEGSDNNILRSTIFNLFDVAAVTNFVFTNPGDENLIARLKRENPELVNLPINASLVVQRQRKSREPNEPLTIDSTRDRQRAD